jgi:hypothetical protein
LYLYLNPPKILNYTPDGDVAANTAPSSTVADSRGWEEGNPPFENLNDS